MTSRPDSELEIRTAEHVDVTYTLAGIGNRTVAAALDVGALFLIEAALVAAFAFLANVAPSSNIVAVIGALLLLAGAFVFPFTYWVLLEAFWNGQTIGKRLTGIRVVRDDGSPVGFFAVVARGLLRIIDLLPPAFLVDVVILLLSKRGQRLGDLVAGTVVVKTRLAPKDLAALRTRATDAATQPVTVRALSGEAQRLVREYALREVSLAPETRARVARTLATSIRDAIPEAADYPDDATLLRVVAASLREQAGERA